MTAPQHSEPEGMNKYDYFALNTEQQTKLNEHKVVTRIEDESYLRSHPELDCLLKDLIKRVLTDTPDDVHQYCADYMANPELVDTIKSQLDQLQRQKTHVDELVQESQHMPELKDEILPVSS